MDFTWKIYHGFIGREQDLFSWNENMVDSLMKAVWLTEDDLGMPGLVQSVIDGREDPEKALLRRYAEENRDAYSQWCSDNHMDTEVTALNAMKWIESAGIMEEWSSYAKNHAGDPRVADRDEFRMGLLKSLAEKVVPSMNRPVAFISRSSDDCGIMLKRLRESQQD